MGKIILTDEILDRACENISHSLQAELLTASKKAQEGFVASILAKLEKRRDEDTPKPEFLRKMVVKALGNTDGKGSQKRG